MALERERVLADKVRGRQEVDVGGLVEPARAPADEPRIGPDPDHRHVAVVADYARFPGRLERQRVGDLEQGGFYAFDLHPVRAWNAGDGKSL